MAKRLKPVEPEVERYFKEDEILIASTCFIYELDTFVNAPGYYHLEDSSFVKTKSLRTEKAKSYTKVKNSIVIRDYKLIAAPKEWLIKNRYTFIT